ncbi:universal stress protein [Desulfosporosinus sp. BG]|uniref:universal stress protein n=1 Tax=Desulfosporosinus sp. BG TaxID=1633135 RepID=UPI000857EF0A|nr:universal stress protein [Desulfosporosinus sp. BG]ODA38817.1 Universal stress protein family [Desulfosporosinus sp. BG]
MKKILVATDASEYSRRALTTALELARKYNAEVELLFVTHLPIVYDSSVNSYIIAPEQIEQEGKHALAATLKGIDISDVTLVKKQMQGKKPADVILSEAENENIDLIVMGTHGYGAIAGSLLGSVSQHVLHKAKCSVLIVK